MIKLSKCNKCGKEVPLAGGIYDEKIIRESLCAPLDCNGNSTFDYSRLKRTKPSKQKCYWCGGDILEITDRERTVTPMTAPKPRPQPQPRFESMAPKVVSEPQKGGEAKIVIIAAFIVLIIVILLNIFF